MQINANHCAMICRCASRICGKESQGFRILVLAGSEWLHVCWRWFCLSAGSRPCSTGGSHLGICSHLPGQPGRWEVRKDRGLLWGRASGVARAGNPWGHLWGSTERWTRKERPHLVSFPCFHTLSQISAAITIGEPLAACHSPLPHPALCCTAHLPSAHTLSG